MSELEHRPPPPIGVPGLDAPPQGWGGAASGGLPPTWPGGAGHGPVTAVPIAPPGGSGRPTILIAAIVTVIVLVWTAPVYFYWWKPRYGLGSVTMSQLRTGDCFDFGGRDDPDRAGTTLVRRVKCSEPHYFEVTEIVELGRQNTLVPETCEAAFERYVGVTPAVSTAWSWNALPVLGTDGEVAADRSVCVVNGAGQLASESARGTKR